MGVGLDVGLAQTPGLKEVTLNPETGEAKVKLSQELLQQVVSGSQNWQRAQASMQEEIDRLTQQEQRARAGPPLLNLLQKLGANLAVQEDSPGFVRALGMTSAQLNPDAETIAARRLPLHLQIAELESRRQQQQVQGLGMLAAAEDRDEARGARAYEQTLREEGRRIDDLRQFVKDGALTEKLAKRLLPKASDEEIGGYLEVSRKNAEAQALQKKTTTALLEERRVTEEFRQKQLDADAAWKRARSVASTKLGQSEADLNAARIANFYSQIGERAEDMALKLQQFALEKEKFDRSTGEKKYQAAIALAGMPWLSEEQKAPVIAEVAAWEKKHGNIGGRLAAAHKSTVPAAVAAQAPPAATPGFFDRVAGAARAGADELFGGGRARLEGWDVAADFPAAEKAKLKENVPVRTSTGFEVILRDGKVYARKIQ